MARRLVVLAALLVGVLPHRAGAQDVVTLLREARIRRIAIEHFERDGLRLPFRAPDPLGVLADSILAAVPAVVDTVVPAPDTDPEDRPTMVDTFELVSRLERPVFRSRFEGIHWAFHQGLTYTPLDTTRTPDLRARLQAVFGAPTQTLVEIDTVETLAGEDVIQFEYWFVVNDTIPIVVLDSNGPLDRGLVVASDARLRDRLDRLRHDLLDRLFATRERAPYVDYWYRVSDGTWHVSGYDGATFFDRRIGRPDLKLGRPTVAEYGTYPPGR